MQCKIMVKLQDHPTTTYWPFVRFRKYLAVYIICRTVWNGALLELSHCWSGLAAHDNLCSSFLSFLLLVLSKELLTASMLLAITSSYDYDAALLAHVGGSPRRPLAFKKLCHSKALDSCRKAERWPPTCGQEERPTPCVPGSFCGGSQQ